MSKIIFDVFPSVGHINSTTILAKRLQKSGHEICYIAPNKSELWREISFPVYTIFTDNNIDGSNNGIDQRSIIGLFFPKLRRILNGYSISVVRRYFLNLKALTMKLRPDLVLLDEHNAPYALLYRLLNIKVALLQTMTDPRRNYHNIPLDSYYIPNDSRFNSIISRLLWFRKRVINKVRYMFRKYFTLGNDILGVNNLLYQEFGRIRLENEIINFDHSFGTGLNGFSRFILAPKHLEFNSKKIEETECNFYINALPDSHSIDYGIRFSAVLSIIQDWKGFVIYCSLGTITNEESARTIRFFKKLSQVAFQNPNDLFIFSVSAHFDTSQLIPAPNNVIVFDTLPQQVLLKHVHLMVTHGGMNSIVECIMATVPMLVYPLSEKWDQPGNSSKVVYYGMGLRGRMRFDSVKQIDRKLKILKNNFVRYKAKVEEMKESLEETSSGGINKIDKIILG